MPLLQTVFHCGGPQTFSHLQRVNNKKIPVNSPPSKVCCCCCASVLTVMDRQHQWQFLLSPKKKGGESLWMDQSIPYWISLSVTPLMLVTSYLSVIFIITCYLICIFTLGLTFVSHFAAYKHIWFLASLLMRTIWSCMYICTCLLMVFFHSPAALMCPLLQPCLSCKAHTAWHCFPEMQRNRQTNSHIRFIMLFAASVKCVQLHFKFLPLMFYKIDTNMK